MAARPPGQGPPGLAAPCGPPSEPPPPAPPGLFLGTARPGAGSSGGGVPAVPGVAEAPAEPAVGDKQAEISGLIAAQVSRLLEKARQSTERGVKVELKGIRDHMDGLNSQLDQMIAQLDQLDGLEPQLGAESVGQLLSNIEKQWGEEIRTLKEELHQTILAHNHNADLIKHHKDTIDALRDKCHRLQGGSARTGAEIQQQLGRLTSLMRQQNTQPKMEPLFERLQTLERNVQQQAALAARAWHYPHPMMPPMPGIGMRPPMPGIPPGMGPHSLVGGDAAGGAAVLPGEAEAAALAAGLEVEKGEALAGLVAETTGAAAAA